MTREESRTLTREKILSSARSVFAREGYGGASVDRIAEHAGFTKGAFYSNFESKEDVFLQLLETTGAEDAEDLSRALHGIREPEAIIVAMSNWANEKRKDIDTPLLLHEMIRRARADATFGRRHEVLFHRNWLAVGTLLSPIFESHPMPTDPLSLGALVMELTYGPALHFHRQPNAGDLVALALRALRVTAERADTPRPE